MSRRSATAVINRTTSDLETACRYLPGGAIFTVGWRRPARPTYWIERGEGAYVYTSDGRRLLDVVLGSASLLLGHCPAAVSEAVKAQIDRGVIFAHLSAPVIELARLMAEAIPGAQKIRFTNSASEAMLYALRAVRARTGKEKVLKFEGAYHGFPDALLFNTNYGDQSRWREAPIATPDSPGIGASSQGSVLVAPYNDIDQTRAIVSAHHADLAAIVVEPVMRGIASRPGFLEGLRACADAFHLPLVFDETITGFRLAYGGAQEFYGVPADLAVYGKGLGAGYPIGAVAGSDEYMSVFDPESADDVRIYALGSFHGNPLCATAAVHCLRSLRYPSVYRELNGYGDRLRDGLLELFRRYGLVVQMTGVGSIVEFFFGAEPITDYRSITRSTLRYKQLLGDELPNHGVFGGGGRYTSSTCHRRPELEKMLHAVEETLGVLRRRGAIP